MGTLTSQNRHDAMKALQVTLLVVGATIIARSPGLAADAAYGEYLASECVTCHRAAVDDGAIPAIVGLPRPYFVNALRDYRAGRRTNPVMQNVARSLNEEQIEPLAAYFASLEDAGPAS
jgi:cytochrome c553